MMSLQFRLLFFSNETATPEIYTLSLHDALPISHCHSAGMQDHAALGRRVQRHLLGVCATAGPFDVAGDRKSTRLNSSHVKISYAVFCLKKKIYNKKKHKTTEYTHMRRRPGGSR